MKSKISWHRPDSTCSPKWLLKSWAFLVPTQYSKEIWPSVQKYSEIPLFKMQTTSFKDIYLINTFLFSTISRRRGLSWTWLSSLKTSSCLFVMILWLDSRSIISLKHDSQYATDFAAFHPGVFSFFSNTEHLIQKKLLHVKQGYFVFPKQELQIPSSPAIFLCCFGFFAHDIHGNSGALWVINES